VCASAAHLLAARSGSFDATSAAAPAAKIRAAYRRVFARDPLPAELKLGLEFVKEGENRWSQFARALLSSNEFLFVN